eukprot:6177758-Pleurochrysis_carterae.AAC.2
MSNQSQRRWKRRVPPGLAPPRTGCRRRRPVCPARPESRQTWPQPRPAKPLAEAIASAIGSTARTDKMHDVGETADAEA